jgi:hypothetical protein
MRTNEVRIIGQVTQPPEKLANEDAIMFRLSVQRGHKKYRNESMDFFKIIVLDHHQKKFINTIKRRDILRITGEIYLNWDNGQFDPEIVLWDYYFMSRDEEKEILSRQYQMTSAILRRNTRCFMPNN